MPLDPRKYHVVLKEQKKKILVICIIFVLLVFLPLSFIYYKFAVKRPSQTADEITFIIEPGEEIPSVAQRLQKTNAVNSAFLFNFYVFLNRNDTNIQAGTYKIKAGSSIVDVVELFQHGTNDVKVTFLEGWRNEQIAIKAAQELSHIDYREFIALTENNSGYLFPDTYFLRGEIQERPLIVTLRTTFETKTENILTDEAVDEIGLSKEQIVNLASLIEREARDYEDKQIVAGILIKRLNEDMKLDVDASVQYAVAVKKYCESQGREIDCSPTVDELTVMNWWPQDLNLDDLNYNSLYNTRLYKGLPPSPICNPGIESIEAVLNYKQTPYYYYVHDIEGNTYYASTIEQHNINIQKYTQN